MINNLAELYYNQIQDLHSAESQLVKALPQMMTAATNDELRDTFTHHLEETKHHKEQLEAICRRHGISPTGEECPAMRGLIEEATKHIKEAATGDVRDAILIACANRVEHYEIAAYGVAKAFAKCLEFDEDVPILDDSLDEEAATDDKLTHIATGGLFHKGINEAARS